jgi:catechol 2,3-dioxygenase-like lactoylglutathione lyase family enzyme
MTTELSIEFNHAMIYTENLERALGFYRDLLGFVMIDTYPGAYARLKSPSGSSTIALHCLEPGQVQRPDHEGIRLYLDVRELDRLCQELAERGVSFDQLPTDMPWGWRHAYLSDPDGHQLSFYWAGEARLQPTRN